MIIERIPEIQKLDKKEKFTLVSELWNSIIDEDYPEISNKEKEILDQRYQNYKNNPDQGVSWKEVQAMLQKQ